MLIWRPICRSGGGWQALMGLCLWYVDVCKSLHNDETTTDAAAAAACMATWTGWQRVRRCASVMYLAAAAALTWRGEMEGWMDGGPASWLGDYWRSSMNDEMRFTPHFNLMPTVSPEIEIRSSTSSSMLRPVLTANSSGWPFQELKTIAVTVQWIVITSFYKKAQLSLTKIVMLALVWRSFCLTAQFHSGFMQ